MARFLRELVRRPTSSRFIATLTYQKPSDLSPCMCLPPQILDQKKFDHGGGIYPGSTNLREHEEIAHFSKLQIYPSFSFGFFLDPVSQYGLAPTQLMRKGDGETEHPEMLWADSVKKKRKTKMNKHKYKKLRKRLRRKTKT